MLSIILISERQNQLSDFINALQKDGEVDLLTAASFEEAILMIARQKPALIVVDEQVGNLAGLDLVRRLMEVNAFINTVVFSALSEEEFHRHSEGLGILARLPIQPDKKDARRLLDLLRQSTSNFQPK